MDITQQPGLIMETGHDAYAWWAHASPSACYWEKNHWTKTHISGSIAPRVMEFGTGMYLNDIWVDLKGQCHRSKVKVTRLRSVWHIVMIRTQVLLT